MLESIQMWFYVEALVPKERIKSLALVLDIWPFCLLHGKLMQLQLHIGPQGTLPIVVNKVERMPKYQHYLQQFRAWQSMILTPRAISVNQLQKIERSKTGIMYFTSLAACS